MKILKSINFWDILLNHPKVILLEPLGYHEMLRLNMGAKIMLTDSGGLQEECCVIGTPCLTLRWNTERPVTLVENGGVSILVGNNIGRIRNEYLSALTLNRTPRRPDLWDGHTADRIIEELFLFNNYQYTKS
jgi:UDP-N-acetylglucosamine 2-epimerase (non-hydrolysing)